MSSIRSLSASNTVPPDIARRLGSGGIKEILEVMWLAYHDLQADRIISANHHEDKITEEWFIKLSYRWTIENRAARVRLLLIPINQYTDDTMAKRRGKSPIIDFCFRAWNKDDGYFGAECKNLYADNHAKSKRYVEKGVKHFISGYYGSKSSVSAMIGYILSGTVSEIVTELSSIIKDTVPTQNLSRDLRVPDLQYKSMHIRKSDNKQITLHHLFFKFAA
jgi:hypothetical protein